MSAISFTKASTSKANTNRSSIGRPSTRSKPSSAHEAAAAHRSQVDREIFDWQIKRPDVRDATLQHMIDDRVRMLSLERDNIDHKLETMHP